MSPPVLHLTLTVIMTFLGLTNALDYVASALIAIIVFLLLTQRRSSKPYPPGPKGLPLIGNILDVPSSRPWLTYARWARELSEFVLFFLTLVW